MFAKKIEEVGKERLKTITTSERSGDEN